MMDYPKPVRFGLCEMAVGEKKVIPSIKRNYVLRSVTLYNSRSERRNWIGITANQVGENVIVIRTY